MKKVLLIKYGEIMLKGNNRPYFERQLINNIRRSITDYCEYELKKFHGRIYIEDIKSDLSHEELAAKISDVFGIVEICYAKKIGNDVETIYKTIVEVAKEVIDDGHKTFKVETKRANKSFPLHSLELSKEAGGRILDEYSDLIVDVRKPDATIKVELREDTYIYYKSLKAKGGMPVGSAGKGILLLSGGIDSPVAGYMMAKRGLKLECVYFHSHPYTTEQAKEKVIELAKRLAVFNNGVRLHIINFTDTQVQIYEKCPHIELTIIMRRVMMRVAEEVAKRRKAKSLVTGESLGQVASQTLESLNVTNEFANMIVFRPLIGMDKVEVIDIAKKIDTFETSILPYEDCCTIFVAKHPQTKPKLYKIRESEELIDIEEMVKTCLSDIEVVNV